MGFGINKEVPLSYKHKKNKILKERRENSKIRVIELRKNATWSEKKFCMLLDLMKIEYVFQYPLFNEWYYAIADFFLPEYNLIIEIDGEIHKKKDIKDKDKRHNKFYESLGYKVLRLSNEKADNLTPKKLKSLVHSL